MSDLTKHTIMVVALAILGAQIVTFAIVQTLFPGYLDIAIKVAPIVSTLVAFPLALAGFWKYQKLALLNEILVEVNSRLREETALAKYEATLDPMTCLLNRTHFVRQFEERRKSNEASNYFLMLDADNFKIINDTYGHGIGDEVLVKITQMISEILREDDLAGRLGGEEFGIFLRGVTWCQAYEIAERIRHCVATTDIDVGGTEPLRATVSIGAVFAAEEHTVVQLMQLADRNLYKAKGNGRNTIVFDNAIENENNGISPSPKRLASI